MKKASVCITHAGFNTVLEALTQGIPQVAIPITNDQPGVAARIAAHQTGVVTSLEDLTVSHLSTLVAEVLNNSKYTKMRASSSRQLPRPTDFPKRRICSKSLWADAERGVSKAVSDGRGGETLAIPPSKSGYHFLQLEITRTPSAAIAGRRNTIAKPNE